MRAAVYLLASASTVFILRELAPVLVPVAVALVLFFVLHPLVKLLARRGIPRAVAAGSVIACVAAGLCLGVVLLALPAKDIATQMPKALQPWLERVPVLKAQFDQIKLDVKRTVDPAASKRRRQGQR